VARVGGARGGGERVERVMKVHPPDAAARPIAGPTLRATPLGATSAVPAQPLLTDRQRQQLSRIATRERLAARAVVYREDAPAGDVFICATGVAKAFRELPSGARRVAAFLFDGDLFGLADAGRYVNTVQVLSPSVVFRIPREPLLTLLRGDAELEMQFLCKVTHELRQSQRRAIVLGRRDAAGRLAMFLQMLSQEPSRRSIDRRVLTLPMTRSDIAEFLALSTEAVSRATSRLVKRGFIALDGPRTIRVLDPLQLDRLASHA
jgi:CRP/FNR family transcriptional regulator